VHTIAGSMATERPERYARQLASHWATRGPVTVDREVTTMRWATGQIIVMRVVEGALAIEVSVPDGIDLEHFAQVVKEHLERFGRRAELNVVWSAPA
jgi:hypothetical protein